MKNTNNQNQKGAALVPLLIALVAVLAGATGYFAFVRKPVQAPVGNNPPTTTGGGIYVGVPSAGTGSGTGSDTSNTSGYFQVVVGKNAFDQSDQDLDRARKIIDKYVRAIANSPGIVPDEIWQKYVNENLSSILGPEALNSVISRKIYKKTTSSPYPRSFIIESIRNVPPGYGKIFAQGRFIETAGGVDTAIIPTSFTLLQSPPPYAYYIDSIY